MDAQKVINRLTAVGYQIRLSENPGKLKITPSGIPDDLLDLVREHKAGILALLGGDYPRCPDSGAPFMPWCAPVSSDDFRKWRGELIAMIEELADLEGWPRDDLDDILSRAINGPVSDLRPNWHHFNERLIESKKKALR